MLDLPEYWHAVAGSLDAEDKKAGVFIHHHHSLGVAREAILRDWLIRHTPEPYRASTGFIYQFSGEWWDSQQCDILVYDPTIAQPDYAIGSMVVVNRQAAKLVIEVKKPPWTGAHLTKSSIFMPASPGYLFQHLAFRMTGGSSIPSSKTLGVQSRRNRLVCLTALPSTDKIICSSVPIIGLHQSQRRLPGTGQRNTTSP
jgi:hypothetical protein